MKNGLFKQLRWIFVSLGHLLLDRWYNNLELIQPISRIFYWFKNPFLFKLIDTVAAPQITWYYRGTALTSNTTLSLNTGDTFTAQCKGAGNGDILDERFVDVYLTKSAAPTANLIAFSLNSPGIPAIASTSKGLLIFSTYQGLES